MTHPVYAIAHRGFSSAAPENTLAAFRKAIELGPEMMECDVRRSRDGHLMVIHDPTVDRTTDGNGAVSEMSLAELKQLDAGSWFGPDFHGERLPTLEEVLDLARGKIKLVIEIKEDGIEDEVVTLVQSLDMSHDVMIASFNYNIGVRMPSLDSHILFVPLTWRSDKASGEEAVRAANEAAAVNGYVLGMNYTAITPAMVQASHAANMRLMAWTVDAEDDMRAMVEVGVDDVASNRLDLLIGVLSEMGVRSA